MKIGQTPDISLAATQASTTNTAKTGGNAAATAKSAAGSAGVSVSVSSLARTLEKPEASAPGDIDTAKVNQVKSAIESGTYVVNPEAIADQLLANAKEMLNRTTR